MDPNWRPLALRDVTRAGGMSPPSQEIPRRSSPPAPTPPPPPPIATRLRSSVQVSIVCFGTRVIADQFPGSASARQWRRTSRKQLSRVQSFKIREALYRECGWGFDIWLDCRMFSDFALLRSTTLYFDLLRSEACPLPSIGGMSPALLRIFSLYVALLRSTKLGGMPPADRNVTVANAAGAGQYSTVTIS